MTAGSGAGVAGARPWPPARRPPPGSDRAARGRSPGRRRQGCTTPEAPGSLGLRPSPARYQTRPARAIATPGPPAQDGRTGHAHAAGRGKDERLRDFRRGRCGAAEGRDAQGRQARLQDLRLAERQEGQRHHPADLVFRPPHRRGVDHRRGPGPRPQAVLHHRAEHAGQRPLVVAEQHAGALRQGALPGRDGLRQRAPAAPAGDGSVRDRADQAGDRLVHGRAPDLPLGLPLPRHGGAHRADLRLRQVLAPQLRVPGGGEGGTHGRRRLEQWLV